MKFIRWAIFFLKFSSHISSRFFFLFSFFFVLPANKAVAMELSQSQALRCLPSLSVYFCRTSCNKSESYHQREEGDGRGGRGEGEGWERGGRGGRGVREGWEARTRGSTKVNGSK